MDRTHIWHVRDTDTRPVYGGCVQNTYHKPVAAELSNREPTHEGSFQGGNLLYLARFPMSRKLDSAVLILLINHPASIGHLA